MSGKSKLTLALLAATALFTFNPGMVSSVLRVDQALSAQELLLDQSAEDGLESLTGDMAAEDADAVPDRASRTEQNAAFLPSQTATAVDTEVAPGENPFAVRVAVPPVRVVPQAVRLTTDGAFTIDPPATAVVVEKQANPFVDAAAAARAKDAATAVTTKAKVDDSALRYYAASKDLKRLGSEMRRLKTLYPDWQPPKDLFSPVANVSEQPLWDIYATGDYAAVRAKIAFMQSTNPKWQPSEDLIQKLHVGEARALINRAFTQKRWAQVISTAQASPQMLVCSEMQVLWQVGESFARTKNYAQSFDLYKYILSSCDDADLRLATVQKASLLLPSQGLASLVAFGRVLPDGTSEFEDIAFDSVRRKLGAFTQDGDFASIPGDADMKRFVDYVQRKGSAKDAGLIAWFFYAQEDWTTANSWFIQAAQYERTPKNIEGVILTLRNLEKKEEALKVARRYLKTSPEIAVQYVEIVASEMTAEKPEIVLKEKELESFEKIVTDQKSALGAQALGWKYLEDGKMDVARGWFTESVDWQPTEGGVVGLAVLAARAKNYKALASLKNQYLQEYAALGDFKVYSPRAYKPKKLRTKNSETKVKKKRMFLFQSDT
jgi:hypothetical protein